MALNTPTGLSHVATPPGRQPLSQTFEDDDCDATFSTLIESLDPVRPVKRQRLPPPSWGVAVNDTTHVSDTHMEHQASSIEPAGAPELSFDEAESAVLSDEQVYDHPHSMPAVSLVT